MKLVRPFSAHIAALAPVAAAWAEPARASLASLSFCGWAAFVHIAFACVPSSEECGSRADAARVAAARTLPSLALGIALDLRAGFAPTDLACVASLAVLSVALLAAAGRNRNAARVGVSLLFVLPALVAGALHLVGLSTTVDSVPWARAALASPLAACLEFTLVRIEARALALGLVGALAPFAVIVLERRSEQGAA